ncbi:MAG: AAA family ATPase [Planctomycetes bacterium]|nr:AAA family ATPase [Planctomycetota bacterium]
MVALPSGITEAVAPAAEPALLRDYDDGPGWPNATPAKEQAYRRGFVEEARRVVRDWPGHDDQIRLQEEEAEAAWKLRQRLRERYSVYAPGGEGPKTHHRGFRPGHEVLAARLRGRHHAMAYVLQSWDETASSRMYERLILPAWLTAIEQWAAGPIHPDRIKPPPKPIEIEETEPYLAEAAERVPLDEPPSGTGAEPYCGNSAVCPPDASSPRLRVVRADMIEMRPPDWLLRGVLERDTLALLFGDPAGGKSFLGIDWACRVATGTPWRGHSVRAGPVVYVAGEGRQGFGRRVRAWQEFNGVSMDGVPLFIAPALALPDAAQLLELVQSVEAASLAKEPVLVVIDTLARCFGGGDENSTQDMSRFVSACDAIRQRWGCTVLVVHHTGHADKTRARGAIALKAALDAEYRLSNNGGLLLTATKMKEAEMPPPLAMKLATVELPGLVDEYGNPVTSAAIEVLDADTGAIVSKVVAAKPGARGKWQEVGLAVARQLVAGSDDGAAAIDTWREKCEAAGMVRQNQHRVLQSLARQGEVIVSGEIISLPTP